ncbi:MAG: extracellular solute-binding protein [Alphaproteobacteria bacterium]|nr:extracellular solute-binding protein [Alphaproteobacteria bacterium]
MTIGRFKAPHLSRRGLLAAGGGIGAAAIAGFPAIVHAETKEIVVGGAASMASWMNGTMGPAFEKAHGCKVVFEGTKSLVNLEKMQKNKGKQYLSVVLMDDPVMILAVQEGLLEKLTPAAIPNLAKTRPSAIHLDGMWSNYLQPWQGVATNTKELPAGIASWGDIYDPKFKSRVVVPSLQNTEGLANLVMAAHLETGKPIDKAQYEIDAGFKKIKTLKPNLLTIYTQIPQAFNLLEQGEAWIIPSAFSSVVVPREKAKAPIKMNVPKEGIFVGPAGVAMVKDGPAPDLARAFIDSLLSVEMQTKLLPETYAFPSNVGAPPPPGMAADVKVHSLDWQFVAKERAGWVARWDRDMAI